MKKIKTELQEIPGVGPSIEKDLIDLGIGGINDLKKKDPEELYNNLMALRKQYIDRCVLYVFRCAVYFAENDTYDPELLKWWNWKEGGNGKVKAEMEVEGIRHKGKVKSKDRQNGEEKKRRRGEKEQGKEENVS